MSFSYKLLKERLDLEDFSGKTAKAVKQDFHAKILMMILPVPRNHRPKKVYDMNKKKL